VDVCDVHDEHSGGVSGDGGMMAAVDAAQSFRNAHAMELAELFARLGSSPAGLVETKTAVRLAAVGPNRFETAKPISALRVLRDQFRSVVVVLLVAAVVVSIAMGDRLEAIAIGCVLIINAAIGFATEYQARRAIASLMQLQTAKASVLRDGKLRLSDAASLVPGDVIEVDAGQRIPADGRIVSLSDLRVDEAVLTGESLPVDKREERLPLDTPLADRTNSVLMGTIAVAGTARVLITHTGSRTELGRLGLLMRGIPEERTPLERRLDALGGRLVWLTLGIAAIVIVLGWRRGAPLETVINTGIALAVAAVPESLPAVATIALAVGVQRMARRRALVRRLPAVEALGSTTVVCTDKTRTLTSGEMQVVHVWTPRVEIGLAERIGSDAPDAIRHALRVAARASREQSGRGDKGIGDPVDAAMRSAASSVLVLDDEGDSSSPPAGWIPFASSRAFSASFRPSGGRTIAAMKGAPRRVLERCDRSSDGRVLDDEARASLVAVNENLARSGLRVLALAEGEVSSMEESALEHLAFVGFIGLMDPPAPGVADTIRRLQGAGLRTMMLTGDQRLTAEAVGRALGLHADAGSMDGRELETLTPAELRDRVTRVAIFSRVVPEHKLAIVNALQARGETVAMLGDGVNDAAALKKADVGVAMGGRGTDVAKEAAAIVLQDDRFETISVAVEEGRIVFDNIRKLVFYLFSCNVGEVMVVLGAGLLGSASPLQPLQLLWLNLVTDTFPALALAMEPGDADVMSRPPRDPHEAVLSRRFVSDVLFYGGLIAAVTLLAFLRVLASHPEAAQTAAFTTLALAQVLHLGNARSHLPVLGFRRAVANPYAVVAVLLSIALQLAAGTWRPLVTTLHVVPMSVSEWLLVASLSAVPAVIGQIRGVLRRRREESRRTSESVY
jgi:Ca2+-transporting ATPase